MLGRSAGTGAAVAFVVDGRLVVDLWGGAATADGASPWLRDSVAQPYSVTKPFAAVCALRLVDAGRLDLDTPAQHYWPELAAPATVRHLLTHQAGLVVLDDPAPTSLFYDWGALCARLAAQQPRWVPGTAHGESALFYGHLVGELVRRVDGRSLGRFLREEICRPLDIDFAIGLDADTQRRAVELTGLDDTFRSAMFDGRPQLFRHALTNPPGALDAAVVNSTEWRAAEVPAINGHGTARAIASFYAHVAAGDVLSAALRDEATTAHVAGPDQVFGTTSSFGLGFAVDDDGFGMGGVGGSLGAASPDGYTVGYVTGSLSTADSALLLENAFRSCVGLTPLS